MTDSLLTVVLFAIANLIAVVFTAAGSLIASIIIDVIYHNYSKHRIKWTIIIGFEIVSAVCYAVGGSFVLQIGKLLRSPGHVSVAIFVGIITLTGYAYIQLMKPLANTTTVVELDDGPLTSSDTQKNR